MTYERPSHPYRQFPTIPVTGHDGAVVPGRDAIQARLSSLIHPTENNDRIVIIAEAYPGMDQEELRALFSPLEPTATIHSDDLALAPEAIDAQIRRDLTDDPVFAVMTTRRLEEFFPPENLDAARRQIDAVDSGIVLVYGVGASLVCRGDILFLADITRWEIQLRYRRGLSNWRTARTSLPRNEKYKRGYFAEWRWADRVKDGLLPRMDFYLDMTAEGAPAMVSGEAYRAALAQAAARPFRMVPYFDPGVWGGDWMAARFGLPENGSNYAWSFDGVPEENSLLLDFGGQLIQTPALNLVHSHPKELLGDRVHARFGREFPIRFDMLDTMNGQNLSLQVHPLTEYIQQHFNMHYTQDESYYLLDAQGEDPCVYLGIRTGTDPEEMCRALEEAQSGGAAFPAERFVNRIPVKKHDHVLIPAGTVHCSGADTMVLEISATPYIFTFKLWDWGRLGLDGRPRPVHLQHGEKVIQWDRTTGWVRDNLVRRAHVVEEEEGFCEEFTGLHEREFLETRRDTLEREHAFTGEGSVQMCNVVDGQGAVIASPEGDFAEFTVHYAETFIIPASIGAFTIRPLGEECKILRAYVR